MKVNKIKPFIYTLVILSIILITIYFIYINTHQNEQESIDIKYQKINMITNFRLGIYNFDSINPHLTQNKDIIQVDSLIFEPLLEITSDYKVSNCLAEEWSKISEKSYIIKLKENVKWQDGTNFTANDVKYTIKSIKNDKKSIYLENVINIDKVEVIDSYTIRLDLKKEISFFEYQLIFPILSQKQYENQNVNESTQIPIGTGKYKITKLEEGIIELTKNEQWHNIENEDQNIETITILIYENAGQMYDGFKSGEIDLINTNSTNYEEYIGSIGYQNKEYKGREYDYLAFNCENTVLQYIEVRQAIQKVINKESIVFDLLDDKAYVADFPLDFGSYIIKDIQLSIDSNLKEANKLLRDYGWKYKNEVWSKEIDGIIKELNFKLVVNKENEKRINVAEEIKRQLEEFGIKITIQKLSDNDYKKTLDNHKFEVILTGVYNGYSPELDEFFGEANLANYSNEEINSISREIDRISSESLQKEKYKQIIEICKKEVPYIGLYRNKSTIIYNQTVMGDITPNNYSIFYNFNKWYRQ